jgi:hypothetical protein
MGGWACTTKRRFRRNPREPWKKKISNWNKAKIGDLVECYTNVKPAGGGPWKAKAGVLRSKA